MNESSSLWSKLGRSKKYREAFVAAQLKRGIPRQIRVLLKQRGWSQSELAERSGLTQGAISRAADPDYGNLTFNNALKIAAGFDIAFVGKFVPFSELASWHDSITTEDALAADSFEDDVEPKDGSFGKELSAHFATPVPVKAIPDTLTVSGNHLGWAGVYDRAAIHRYVEESMRRLDAAGINRETVKQISPEEAGTFLWGRPVPQTASSVDPSAWSSWMNKKPLGREMLPTVHEPATAAFLETTIRPRGFIVIEGGKKQDKRPRRKDSRRRA